MDQRYTNDSTRLDSLHFVVLLNVLQVVDDELIIRCTISLVAQKLLISLFIVFFVIRFSVSADQTFS